MSHHCNKDRRDGGGNEGHTIDSNGHDFGQDVAISTFKGGDTAELIEFPIVITDSVDAGVGMHEFDVQVVLLCNNLQTSSSGVALVNVVRVVITLFWLSRLSPCTRKACQMAP